VLQGKVVAIAVIQCRVVTSQVFGPWYGVPQSTTPAFYNRKNFICHGVTHLGEKRI
jgi:hypothetical protein